MFLFDSLRNACSRAFSWFQSLHRSLPDFGEAGRLRQQSLRAGIFVLGSAVFGSPDIFEAAATKQQAALKAGVREARIGR